MKMSNSVLIAGAMAASCLPMNAHAEPAAESIPLELVLLVDTSGSVDTNEYELQRLGYAAAFRDPEVVSMFDALGGAAVVYIEWSDTHHQSVRVPWTYIGSAADCASFASAIENLTRDSSGQTMLAPALEFALNELDTNGYESLRRVIDVSGDGRCENFDFFDSGLLCDGETDPAFYGTPWSDVVASMTGRVDQVNGICIGLSSTLVDFYENELPYGEAGFAVQVDSFTAFAEGIKGKLLREVGPVPGMFD